MLLINNNKNNSGEIIGKIAEAFSVRGYKKFCEKNLTSSLGEDWRNSRKHFWDILWKYTENIPVKFSMEIIEAFLGEFLRTRNGAIPGDISAKNPGRILMKKVWNF